MRVATIIYHKNILSIYKEEWIEKCIDSIKNQSVKDFIVYELNYGDGKLNLGEKYNLDNHKFYNKKLKNHAEAMNFLFKKCIEDNIDVVFNNNMDDYSDYKRFEIQLSKIKEGYHLVASNFNQINKENVITRDMSFSKLNIEEEFKKNHNIICHPSVCYSREFIKNNSYIPEEIPEEDFNLWKRTIGNYKFYICDEFLLNYRIHKNQITESGRNTIKEDRIEVKSEIENNIIQPFYLINRPVVIRCSCGEPKDRVRYNFCQKCNKLY